MKQTGKSQQIAVTGGRGRDRRGLTGWRADHTSALTCRHKAVIPLQGASARPSGKRTPSEVTLPYASVSILKVMRVQVKRHGPPSLHHMEVHFGILSSCCCSCSQEAAKRIWTVLGIWAVCGQCVRAVSREAGVAVILGLHGEDPVCEGLLLAGPLCGCITGYATTHAGEGLAMCQLI